MMMGITIIKIRIEIMMVVVMLMKLMEHKELMVVMEKSLERVIR